MGAAVVNGGDLDVQMIVAAIELLVLDTDIREMDLLVEIRELMFTSPICNLLRDSIGAAATLVAVTIVLVQPPLIRPFEFVVEDNTLDTGVTLDEALRGTQIGSVSVLISPWSRRCRRSPDRGSAARPPWSRRSRAETTRNAPTVDSVRVSDLAGRMRARAHHGRSRVQARVED
jgi:hypothetical protein